MASEIGPGITESVMAIGYPGLSLNKVQWVWDKEECDLTVSVDRAVEKITAEYWAFRNLDLVEVASKYRENIIRGLISSRAGLQAISSHPELGELGWELHRGSAGHEFVFPMALEWVLNRKPCKVYLFGMDAGRMRDDTWRREMNEVRRLESRHTCRIIGFPQKYYALFPDTLKSDGKA